MRVIHAFRSLPLLIGTALVVRLGQTVNSRDRERGDVPGWVMITFMNRSKSHLVAGSITS